MVSIYKIYIKCRLWLEMYEAHLRTGKNIDFFLNHQALDIYLVYRNHWCP